MDEDSEPRPHRTQDEEKIRWDLMLLDLEKKSNTVSRNRVLQGGSHCCKTPFEELKSIKLCEMKVPMIHRGKYLVCKVIGKPYSILGIAKPFPLIGVNTLVEDLNGDVEEASVFNFPLKSDGNWLCPGTILLIKEPWLQYISESKIPFIRIESPSDVIFVDPADEEFLIKIGAEKWYISMSKDAEFWRTKANECYKNGKFEEALFVYERGIRCDPENPILYLNKSAACLKMDAFYMAFKSAKIGLDKGGNREKALFRMGQAKYGMREWQKAADYFLKVLNEFPDNISASAQLKRVKDRLAEQNHGKYNFKQMFIDSKKEKPDLDVAHYKGSIEIADIPGKGRGIIATKDIKEGTLLVVSKPFASGYFPKNLMSSMPGNPTLPQHILQFINAMQNLQNNPEQAKEVYKLYARDNMGEYEDIPFGIIDAQRIQQICANNPFVPDDICPDDNISNDQNLHLYILPSYFNHSCLPNAFRSFFGDIIAIRASEDIKKGEEIYLPYIYPLNGYLERKNAIMARGFICQCKLCELDANDPNCLSRDQMLKKLKRFKEDYSPNFVVAHGEPILKKIRQSYANRKELKVVLAQAYVILASAYFNTQKSSRAITCLEEAVALMNNPLKYSMRIADICVNIGTCYLSSGNRKKFNDMIKKAMTLSFCNNDKEYFKMLYPEIVDYL